MPLDWRQLLAFSLIGAGGGNPMNLVALQDQRRREQEQQRYGREFMDVAAPIPQVNVSPQVPLGGSNAGFNYGGPTGADQVGLASFLARGLAQGIDPTPWAAVAQMMQPKAAELLRGRPGEQFFDPRNPGKPVFSVPNAPEKPDIREVNGRLGIVTPGGFTQIPGTPEPAPDKGTAAHQDALNLGLQPGTKPYSDYIRERTLRPATQIQIDQPQFGTIPPGYQLVKTANGALSMQPIPGGPAEREIQEAEFKKGAAEQHARAAADIVVTDIGRARELINKSSIPVTGWGAGLKAIPGPARDLSTLLDSVRANIGFDRLQQMRQTSPTGGALGQVAVQELQMLQAVMGSLEQSQSRDQFLFNLKRLEDTYNLVVHGTVPQTKAQISDDDLLRKYGVQ